METHNITVLHNGESFPAVATVTYAGINSIITAQVGGRKLIFRTNENNGWDIKVEGPPMDQAFLDAIAVQITKGLE